MRLKSSWLAERELREQTSARWTVIKLFLDVALRFALLIGGIAASIYFASLGFVT